MTVHVHERKFVGHVLIMNLPVNANLINQNKALNLLLKARIKSTSLNLQTATPRVYFASTEG